MTLACACDAEVAMPELAELHRLTPDEYRRMSEAGVFDDDVRLGALGDTLRGVVEHARGA